MTLADIVAPAAVEIATDVSSKKRALEEMARLLAEQSNIDQRVIFTALINREKLGSTGLGSGVGIPHGRIPGLEQAVAAVLRLPAAIDFESVDRTGVDLLFGLIVPKDATAEHLQILAGIASVCQDEATVSAMREADDPAAIHALLGKAGVED